MLSFLVVRVKGGMSLRKVVARWNPSEGGDRGGQETRVASVIDQYKTWTADCGLQTADWV